MASTVWKGSLAFGLVSFPVRLIKAARKERVPLRYVRQTAPSSSESEPRAKAMQEPEEPEQALEPQRSGPTERAASFEPVRLSYSDGVSGDPVPHKEIQRGYEVSPGNLVVVRPEEIRQLRVATSAGMEILRTVRLSEIDPVFLETSYYLVPDSNGERPYTLFYRSLLETEYAALAQIAMHGRDHIMVVRPGKTGLIAHTMFYTNEVRESQEYVTDSTGIQGKELDLAKRFLLAIADHFRPEEFTDRYREHLEELIASKDAVNARAASEAAQQKTEKVVDIMDALRKSLEKLNAGKPKATPVKKPARTAVASETQHKRRRA